MSKKLSDMTLEELWQLFHIILTAPQPCWQEWYNDEHRLLESILPHDKIKRIAHIGSTAVGTIYAKPTVDILVETFSKNNFFELKKILIENGYLCMWESSDRISFNKGYTEIGYADRVFHLHLRVSGDNDELYFRDYLIEHPDIAKKYEILKLGLQKKFEHDRDGYTDSKTCFVKKYTALAKQLYKEKNTPHR